eukprot:gene5742-7143_t
MTIYKASCHCKTVQFDVKIDDLNQSCKCNCSSCVAVRLWEIHVKPSDITFTAGQDMQTTYQYGSKSIDHNFCKVCGVRTAIKGNIPELGGEFYGVNIGCLGLTPEVLGSIQVCHLDGLNDNWGDAPKITNYL